MSNTMGMTVTGIIMMTVPVTAGVRIRRRIDRRLASVNWTRDDRKTSVASMPGPPSARAVTHTAMKAPEVPMTRM